MRSDTQGRSIHPCQHQGPRAGTSQQPDRYGDPPCRSSARGKKKKTDLNILVNLWEPLPKWLYAAYIAPEKEIGSNRQLYVDIMAALIKANRFIYNNKAKTVEIATKYTQQPADVVSETYDILANAGAWPVNDGLPKDMVEWTINKQVELGTIKAEEKPSYEKLIDVSVIQAALGKAGGRLTGDKRWD